MYEYIAIVLLIQILTLVFLYLTDMERKFFSRSGVKQCKLLTLKRGKYLFLFYERKGNIITKHAFICMIAYYIVNGAGFAALLIQAITGNDSFEKDIFATLIFANIGLLIVVVGGNPRKLTPDQNKEYWEYRMKLHEERKKQKREKQ